MNRDHFKLRHGGAFGFEMARNTGSVTLRSSFLEAKTGDISKYHWCEKKAKLTLFFELILANYG